MSEDLSRSPFKRGLDLAAEQFYRTIPAIVGMLLGASITGWVNIRDNSTAIGRLETEFKKCSECSSRTECDLLRSQIHAIELKLAVVGKHIESNDAYSMDLKTRIADLERAFREFQARISSRAGNFTGASGTEQAGTSQR